MAAMRQLKPLDERVLESEVMSMLPKALSEGWVKYLLLTFGGRENPSYEVFGGEILKAWKDVYSSGTPVTKHVPITEEEFLDEFQKLPYEARLAIHQSLKEGYTPPPEDTREKESAVPGNLFGY